MTSPEHDALEARTTCTARVNGRRKQLLVYWLDLLAVLEHGAGDVVHPETGARHHLTWDPETGYTAL